MSRCFRARFGRADGRGFSLVELMIAMALGLGLSAVLATVFVKARQQAHIEAELARIQESGRYALYLLSRELRMAGFWGGLTELSSRALPASAPGCGLASQWALTPRYPLDVINDFDRSTLSALGLELSCLNSSQIRPQTDVIAIKRSATEPTLRDGRYSPGSGGADSSQWFLRVADHGLTVDWRYIESGRLPAADVRPGSTVDYWELYANLFFIRRYSERGNRIPTLCTEVLSAASLGPVECLIEGVEDMQVEFGIDSDGDRVPNYYRAGPDSAEMRQAVSARLYLLMRSIEQVAGYRNRNSYQLGQKHLAAMGDAYLRRLFSTTVWMSNVAMRGNH